MEAAEDSFEAGGISSKPELSLSATRIAPN